MKNGFFNRYGLYFAWLLSIIGTLGSLYFSGILGLIPCAKCWYQRVFLFPLPVLLVQSVYGNIRSFVRHVLPLPIIGGLIALYQILQDKLGSKPATCGMGNVCSIRVIANVEFLTLPLLSLLLFGLITLFLVLALPKRHCD